MQHPNNNISILKGAYYYHQTDTIFFYTKVVGTKTRLVFIKHKWRESTKLFFYLVEEVKTICLFKILLTWPNWMFSKLYGPDLCACIFIKFCLPGQTGCFQSHKDQTYVPASLKSSAYLAKLDVFKVIRTRLVCLALYKLLLTWPKWMFSKS